jgi:hypothetical protein
MRDMVVDKDRVLGHLELSMVNYCRGDGSGVSEVLNHKMKMDESTCFGKETYSWEEEGES